QRQLVGVPATEVAGSAGDERPVRLVHPGGEGEALREAVEVLFGEEPGQDLAVVVAGEEALLAELARLADAAEAGVGVGETPGTGAAGPGDAHRPEGLPCADHVAVVLDGDLAQGDPHPPLE